MNEFPRSAARPQATPQPMPRADAESRRRAMLMAGIVPPAQLQPHLELIDQSHQRCAALGLSRIERPDHAPLPRSDLGVARERNQRLFAHAAPVMEMLFEQIAGTDSMIVLTDAQGTILYSVGDDDFLGRAAKVALAPGVSWAEHSKGTNAIGTALFAEAPTLVHAEEHFMHANNFLTCSAAPIFDPRGSMLGVLDVSGDRRSYHQHTMGLVRMSARMIENQWLGDDYSHRLRLHFHGRAEFIGTLLEGIVVVGGDGRILGANRSGLDQIGLGSAALRMHTLETLFATSADALFDHFRDPLATPRLLRLGDGRELHVVARFNAPARPVAIGLQPQSLSPQDGVADAASTPPAEPAAPAAPAASPTSATPATPGTAPPGNEPAPPASGLQGLLTGDAVFDAAVRRAQRIADLDITLLLEGEAGTGKQVLARALHADSRRARLPFKVLHCAALGSSTPEGPGSDAFALAGTLFLDDVAELPPAWQARLLHWIDRHPLVLPCIVSASRPPLREAVAAGRFSEDLALRLSGLVLRLPPLRERSDLEALARTLVGQAGAAARPAPALIPTLSPALLQVLAAHPWPGNLRQLASVLRTAVALAAGEPAITPNHLSADFTDALRQATATPAYPLPEARSSGGTLEEAEVQVIRAALDAANGNVSRAARQLGVSRNTLYRKLKLQPGR